ncbi:MAG: DNA double-strand break repair nuclease NurA [Anaerolineae bacterium]|nr:DNA double-strand break repair nuclease NurA [Anaerolineae bacterium]
MALEFNKVIDQVQRMGRYLGKLSLSQSDRLAAALERFYAATDLDAIHARIELVRNSSISGYRGAAPLPKPYSEFICGIGEPPPMPERATLIAADGSQIYPDHHIAALYYLINIGVYTYHHGQPRLPEQVTAPELAYSDSKLEDEDGRTINNQTVNMRRSVEEMRSLARHTWDLREEARPLVAIHDGTLLKFFGGIEIAYAKQVERDYMDALQQLHDTGAILCGYVDNPRSTYLISLLHLMSLADDEVNDLNLKTNGELEGLTDVQIFARVLGPGQRSALMTQNSPQNAEYHRRSADFEIASFYVNVAPAGRAAIARVDVPLWAAREPAAIDALHALLLHQCSIQGRRHYPYALTRADELAVVSSAERDQLNQLINVEMRNNKLHPEASNKLQTKYLARGERRQHRLRG